jgi:5-methylcytosine-specific restriction endonuclease McrA
VEPLNAEQVKVQFTMSRQVLAKMQQAQDLLGHQVARHDLAALFERLLDMALPVLEKRKFAATARPRAPRKRTSPNARSIPAHVQREVWKRDAGRCTFVSATGRRCAATRGLEFDHVKPVALGGEATFENVRLLCSKHNQLEARRRLGAEFMKAKRSAAKHGRVADSGGSVPALSNRPVVMSTGAAPVATPRQPATASQ